MAAQVALRRQQAQEESEALGLQRRLYPGSSLPGALASWGSGGMQNPRAEEAELLATASRQPESLPTPTFEDFQQDSTKEKQVQKGSNCDLCKSGQEEPVSKTHQSASPNGNGIIGKQHVTASFSEHSTKSDSILSPDPTEQSGGEDSPKSFSSSDLESGSESEWTKNCIATRASLSTVASRPRDPLRILTNIFPSYKHSQLEVILQFCKGDVVQAIEQVLKGTEHMPDCWDLANSDLENTTFQRPSNFSLAGIGFGTLSNKSAFSPLQTMPGPYEGDSSLYSFHRRLAFSPLCLAYSPGRVLSGFMSPYLTLGLVPGLPFQPVLDYAFSGIVRDYSQLPSRNFVTTGKLYFRPNQEN